MATDTAHIKLELASGRSGVTAPFHQTAARLRNNTAEDQLVEAPPPAPPANAPIIDAPLCDPIVEPPRHQRRTWIALIAAAAALVALGWWAMAHRTPDVDPREVIKQHLSDARAATAEGRYTDPPERSAHHYYNAVLALDPNNADAVAGIDAIADRHVTDARVLLSEQRIAEAGVAIEKARRIRPDHSSLLALDVQLRIELKKILAAANAALLTQPAQEKPAKVTNAAPPRTEPAAANRTSAPSAPLPQPAVVDTPSPAIMLPEPAIMSAAATSPAMQLPVAIAPLSGATPTVEEPAPVIVGPPKLVKLVEPLYPQEALIRGIEGWVDVSLAVNAAGDVVAPRIEDSNRGRLFNRAALNAVQQWKYEPREADSSERLRVRVQFRQSR